MKQPFLSRSILSLFMFSFLFITGSVHTLAQSSLGGNLANTAATPTNTVECAGTIQAGVCIPTNTGLPEGSVQGILATFMNWLLGIIGMIAIIAFIISGMQYLASVGDPKIAETAKKNMLNSIIGVIVALSGFVIIQAISTLLTAPSDNIF